jgi:hypothetical protein
MEMQLQVVGDLMFYCLMGIRDPIWKGLTSIGDLVGNANKVVETLWAMPKLKWRPVGLRFLPCLQIFSLAVTKLKISKKKLPTNRKHTRSVAGPLVSRVFV